MPDAGHLCHNEKKRKAKTMPFGVNVMICVNLIICITTSSNEFIRVAVQGSVPPLQQALELHTILSQSDTNLRQPVGLEEQLLMGRMGSDVGQSMLQMLQARSLRLQCFMPACLASSWALTFALLAFA